MDCNHIAPMWLGMRDQIMCDRCGFTWIDPILHEALMCKPIELSTTQIMAYIMCNGYRIPQQALTN